MARGLGAPILASDAQDARRLFDQFLARFGAFAARVERGDVTPRDIYDGLMSTLAPAFAEVARHTGGDPYLAGMAREIAGRLGEMVDQTAARMTHEAAQAGLVTVGADPALADANGSPAHATPELPKNSAGERGGPRPDAAHASPADGAPGRGA